MAFLNEIGSNLTTILTNLGAIGAVIGCLLILLESIFPPLPLSVFITINFSRKLSWMSALVKMLGIFLLFWNHNSNGTFFILILFLFSFK